MKYQYILKLVKVWFRKLPKINSKQNTLYPNCDKKYLIPELKLLEIPFTQVP